MSERASNHVEKTGPGARYFSEAVRWENDVIRSVKRSRFRNLDRCLYQRTARGYGHGLSGPASAAEKL